MRASTADLRRFILVMRCYCRKEILKCLKNHCRKSSIGLNLTPDENDNRKLLEDYHQYLSSLYFSFPMGMQYYSRLGIKDEFQDEDSAQRLFNVLTYAKELGVRRELALNTYHLSDLDIDYAIEFTKKI